jgi:hypothetical protein
MPDPNQSPFGAPPNQYGAPGSKILKRLINNYFLAK